MSPAAPRSVLKQCISKIRVISPRIQDIVVTHQKLTPNPTLPDQGEELLEVLDFLCDRCTTHQAQGRLERHGDNIALNSLLAELDAIEAWLAQNDAGVKGGWQPQQISDGIEAQRERLLRGFTARICLAMLEVAVEGADICASLQALCSRPATSDIDCIRLGGMASTLASSSLANVIAQVAEEQAVLQHGVGDFETSSAASQMVLILQTLEATADSVGASSRRSQTLAKMLEDDFHLDDSRAPSLYRRASASTFDSPLDPSGSPRPSLPPMHVSESSSFTRRTAPEAPLSAGFPHSPEAMYTNFRPSFVPSISDSTFDTESNGDVGTYISTSTARLPYLDRDAEESVLSQQRPQRDVQGARQGSSDGAHYNVSQAASAEPQHDRGNVRAGSSRPAPINRHTAHGHSAQEQQSLGERMNLTSSVIAFNARDALTNAPLIDPVLGSDGLIHDRWSLIDAKHEAAKGVRILGDVHQLREALHADPKKQDEFGRKRAAYRQRAVDECTATNPKAMRTCIRRLSDVLQWKPEDVEILTRRGVLHYRLRQLSEAKADLDLAVRTSQTSSLIKVPNLDSLRYRCQVLCEIRDRESALADMEEVVKQTPDDPLVLSLRATIRAGKGDFENARSDLDIVKSSLEKGGGSQSMLADENRDLDLLAKGWAHSSLGEIESAVADFEMAQSLRIFDAYSVSCVGISLVHMGLTLVSRGEDAAGRERMRQGLGELSSAVAAVSRNDEGDELSLPSANGPTEDAVAGMTLASHAYDPFFLRGMANFACDKYEEALRDFDVARALCSKIVKDTGEFHCVLGILQAETGQYEAATRSFDFAMALKPEERENYVAKRATYGL